MEPPSKKAKYMCKFREEFSEKWKCMKPSVLGEHFAHCSVCVADFKIGHGGRNDIAKHVETPKHRTRMEASKSKTLSSFFKPSSAQDDENEVLTAEYLFAAFLVEHNIPLAVADHAADLFRRMFPDSKIAKKYASKRTKTRQLIGTLSKSHEMAIVKPMLETPFSISTDGSNDRGSEQLYPIVVHYNNSAQIATEVLTITIPEGASTGQNIFDALNRELVSRSLSWDNCISFGADNASVMLGRLNGVAAHIKAQNPTILIQGCSCHLLHIAAKKGAEALRFKIEELLVELFHYVENSTKRMKALEDFQREAGVALRKILKHGPTRWLSLLTCAQRSMGTHQGIHHQRM